MIVITLIRLYYHRLENCTSHNTLPSNIEVAFALNPAVATDGIFDFDIPSNVKLHRRPTTNLEDKL